MFPADDLVLALDIDYIFKWECDGNVVHGFWVSPCKLLFSGVLDLSINLAFGDVIGLSILELERSPAARARPNESETFRYKLACDRGEISFTSTGFAMHVLKDPVFSTSQGLGRENEGRY